MAYFGNVSSFPCLEFTAAFSRNQAFFDARNDFPLFPQSTISHFGHFAETFPISPGIPAIRTRPSRKTACHWEPVRTDVAPSGDSLRSQSVPPWLPLWGSWRRSRLRGQKSPSPPPAPLPEGEARPSSGTASPCRLYIIVQLPLAIVRF